MRLTCPRCAAQYEIADSAIPRDGREVECSACSHVWHQAGPEISASVPNSAPPAPAETPAFDPEARPVLSRALDESVLAILREEAARELQARAGESRGTEADHNPATDTPQAAPPEASAKEPGTEEPGVEWPATTLTTQDAAPPKTPPPAPKTPKQAAAADAATETQPDTPPPAHAETEPEPDAHTPTDPVTDAAPPPARPQPIAAALPDAVELAATLTRAAPPATTLPLQTDETTPPAADPARPLLRPDIAEIRDSAPSAARPPVAGRAAAPPARQSGYAAGFGLAAMLALGVVAVYALAPQIPADRGGAVLAEWRQGLDRGRSWLHERILGE